MREFYLFKVGGRFFGNDLTDYPVVSHHLFPILTALL